MNGLQMIWNSLSSDIALAVSLIIVLPIIILRPVAGRCRRQA